MRLYSNRGLASFHVPDDPQAEFVEFLAAAEPYGRILLAGVSRPAYGDGQVAYLPGLTEKKMLAFDYYYFSEEWTSGPFPPPPFSEDADRLFSDMKLYNVTDVVAYEGGWGSRLLTDDDRYREVKSIHHPYGPEGYDARDIKVLRPPSYLLRGEGTVGSLSNRTEVTLSEPRNTVVLMHRWEEGLRSEGPVDLFPYDSGRGIRLVGVKTNGEMRFALRFESWL